MSGTSLDGVDVVPAAIDETMVVQQASLTAHSRSSERHSRYLPWTAAYVSATGQLRYPVRPAFQAVNALLAQQQRLQPRDIVAIGCHGQTVWHEPTGEAPHTLQIGDNNHIVAHIRGLQWSAIFGGGILRWADKARCWCLLSITRCCIIRRKKTWRVLEYRRHRQFEFSAFPRTGGCAARHGAG